MKISVVIGRFQPFHNGHLHLVRKALQETDRLIIVLGSSNRSRSVKNPYTVSERKRMILSSLRDISPRKEIFFVESPDNLYKEWSWKAEIVRRVNDLIPSGVKRQIFLYGHTKDDSSYYLKEFPEWKYVEVDSEECIDATNIRNAMYVDHWGFENIVPEKVYEFLQEFATTDTFSDILEEHEFFEEEKRKFDSYPHPETLNFICSDAVVVCKGHIVLVKRKHAPGKNTWALPGGFKERTETLLDCAIRELQEETNIRVPEKVLRGSIRDHHMFDHPMRSGGIQRLSMAYYIDVRTNPDGSLPELRPASDALEVQWVELSDAMSRNLFEDHLDIIQYFI